MVSFPNGTPLWEEEEWCMNASVVIISMWRLPKNSVGVTQRSILLLVYASVYVAAWVQQLCVTKGSCRERTNCAVGDSVQAIVWTLEAGGVKKRLGSQLIRLGRIGERTEQGGQSQ